MRYVFSIGLLLSLATNAVAQRDEDIRSYIERYKKIAIEEMTEYGIPASITIAQGIHESAAGKSKLALNSNNHFGIKCHKDWNGSGYKHDDDKPQECFRVYQNPEESYRDHSQFLKNRKWYKPLFELNPTDYKAWAHGLKKAGYATNPRYAEVLIGVIEKYDLHALDKMTKEHLKPEFNCGTNDYVNGRKCIALSDDMNVVSLSQCLRIDRDSILSYNDVSDEYEFKKGEFVFLSPKKNACNYREFTTTESTTFHAISQRFGLRLSSLLQYNNESRDREIERGARILLHNEMPQTETASNSHRTHHHHVKQGESLYSIARKYDTTIDALKKANHLTNTNLYPGQKLIVKK